MEPTKLKAAEYFQGLGGFVGAGPTQGGCGEAAWRGQGERVRARGGLRKW